MIKKFNDVSAKKEAEVNKSMFMTARTLYEKDPQLAGDFALSILEYVLTGQISTDDTFIQELIKSYN